MPKRILQGTVVSDKNEKTVVVKVERRTLQEDVAHRQALWRINGECGFRAAVPPARLSEFVPQSKLSDWVADPAFGVILGSITREQTSALREVIARFSGTIAFTSGDGLEYEPPSAGQRQLLGRLKLAFDPDNRLTPLPWVK